MLIGIGIVLILWYVDSKLKLRIIDYFQLIIFALLGARFVYILHNPSQISQFFNFQTGGLAFFGALFGVLIAILFISKRRKIQFLSITDNILFLVPIAQSLGRIGNFFNHEIFGYPTNLPWKIFIPLENRPAGYESYSYYHPTFAYEIILNLLNFFLLSKIKNRKIRGLVTATYLITYGIIRLLMNRLRIEGEYLFGIETSDISSVIIISIGTYLLLKIMKTNFVKKFAEIVSIVLSPFVLTPLPIVAYLFTYQVSTEKLWIFAVISIIIGLSSIMQNVIFLKLKIISDWNVPDRKDRPFYNIVSAIIFLIGFIISYFYLDSAFQAIPLSLTVILFIFAIISLFWKISGHLTFLTFSITMTFLIINSNYVLLAFLLIPLLIWSRLLLKHHTLYQTLGGSLLGIIIPWIVWVLIL